MMKCSIVIHTFALSLLILHGDRDNWSFDYFNHVIPTHLFQFEPPDFASLLRFALLSVPWSIPTSDSVGYISDQFLLFVTQMFSRAQLLTISFRCSSCPTSKLALDLNKSSHFLPFLYFLQGSQLLTIIRQWLVLSPRYHCFLPFSHFRDISHMPKIL